MGEVILLLGLEEPLERDLEHAIPALDRTIHTHPLGSPDEALVLIERLRPDLVFLGGDWRDRPDLLRTGRVVVVSQRAEVAEWLDAIEAGARDYCSPPFESAHVLWILQSAVRARGRAAA